MRWRVPDAGVAPVRCTKSCGQAASAHFGAQMRCCLIRAGEVRHLIKKARPRITRSGVVDTETGGSSVSEIRTSSGMFFSREEDAVIKGGTLRQLGSCLGLISAFL